MARGDDDLESAQGASRVHVAGHEEVQTAAVLLDAFNLEFDDPTPGPRFLADRLGDLISAGGTHVLLGGDGPDGVAVMRVRPALWSAGTEAYLEELYVVPDRRRLGLGQGDGDADAHRLYERNGFSNFADDEGRERMLFYEREL